jgi:hypothetical protein
MSEQKKTAPFSWGTRRDMVPSGTIGPVSLTNGSVQTFKLSRNGLGHAVLMQITIDMAGTGGTPTWANALTQAYEIVNNIKISNNSNLIPINVSMYGLARLISPLRGYTRDQSLAPNTNTALPATGASRQLWQFWVKIPLGFNDGVNFARGLVMLQSNTAEWTVQLTFNSISSVVAGVTGQTATAYVNSYLTYFEIPDQNTYDSAALNWMYVITEELNSNNLSGAYSREISPLQGELIRAQTQFVAGATPATQAGYQSRITSNPLVAYSGPVVDGIQYAINNLTVPVAMSSFQHDALFKETYGFNPQPGQYVFHDAATVLDTPNQYSYPDFYYQVLDPSLFSSVRLKADLNANGGTPAVARQILEYFQKIQYQG